MNRLATVFGKRRGSGTATAIAVSPSFTHLDVTSYGAVGDGSTDNYTAFVAAVAAAKTQGKPLYVPPGTYNYSQHLIVDSVVMFGSNTATTVLQGTVYGDHALYLTGTGPSLHNLTVSATGRSPRSSDRRGNGIYVNAATNYSIRNCHVLNVDGCGIMTEFSSFGLEKNNVIELTGADGTYHTENTHDVEVAYCKTIETGDDAISWTTYGGRWVYNVNVHHNSCVGNYQSRVLTANGVQGNIVFHDNHIDGGTAGISIVAHSGWSSSAQNTGVEAYGNTIRNINKDLQNTGTIGGGAIAFWNDNAGVDSGLSLHDNVIYKPGLYGIYVGGTGVITATVANSVFYTGGTLFHSDNTSATITQTGLTTPSAPTYPGDLVPSTVGGHDATYQYAP